MVRVAASVQHWSLCCSPVALVSGSKAPLRAEALPPPPTLDLMNRLRTPAASCAIVLVVGFSAFALVSLSIAFAPLEMSSDVVGALVVWRSQSPPPIWRSSLFQYAMSGNVMILTASLVIFHDLNWFVGPVVVGLCCAVFDYVHLRAREWDKIAFNASADSIAFTCSCGVLEHRIGAWV